jgi:hypothetical protein
VADAPAARDSKANEAPSSVRRVMERTGVDIGSGGGKLEWVARQDKDRARAACAPRSGAARVSIGSGAGGSVVRGSVWRCATGAPDQRSIGHERDAAAHETPPGAICSIQDPAVK